jgi:DNA-directed RNA polymerase subunit N (RpoN/RPB10)
MIIPVRCFSCGKILADKYNAYKDIVNGKKLALKQDPNEPTIIDMNSEDVKKTPEGEALDDLGIHRMCCRKILLYHIELIDEI